MSKKDPNLKKAVGYSRTSGEAKKVEGSENERDGTSIPSQKQAIESFCKQEGLLFLHHYVDEAKSGASIAGRDDFKRLMRDAASSRFDIVVFWKVDRFGRDGVDILTSAKVLPRDFGVEVMDTTKAFDSSDKKNPVVRFALAGVAEQERLNIMQRMMGGRIARAKQGRLWCQHPPVGRGYDKKSHKWYITKKGHTIATILKRYIKGESLSKVAHELGIKNHRELSTWIHKGQLAEIYHVRFRCDDIGLDETVAVPAVPQIVSSALLNKVKKRLAHNKTFNRFDAKQYRLSGFIYCSACGKALSGHTINRGHSSYEYFRHDQNGCPSDRMSIRGENLTESILDYLYRFFLDEPAFNKAVQAAMPSDEQRDELTSQHDSAIKQLTKIKKKIKNLVYAIEEGGEVAVLLNRIKSLETEQTECNELIEKLKSKLESIPSFEAIKTSADLCRLDLIQQHTGKNWQKLSHQDTKEFLHHLFGDNPKQAGLGIFVNKQGDQTTVAFKGKIDRPFDSGKTYPLEAFTSKQMHKLKKTLSKTKKTKYDRDRLALMIRAIETKKNGSQPVSDNV